VFLLCNHCLAPVGDAYKVELRMPNYIASAREVHQIISLFVAIYLLSAAILFSTHLLVGREKIVAFLFSARGACIVTAALAMLVLASRAHYKGRRL
jgi:hypothetical protein